MNAATRYVAKVNNVAANVPTSDPRFDMRLTEKFGDDESDRSGWTWVAGILIGGVLIVSGYLEQGSTSIDRASTHVSEQKYGTNKTTSQYVAVDTVRADPRAVTGY